MKNIYEIYVRKRLEKAPARTFFSWFYMFFVTLYASLSIPLMTLPEIMEENHISVVRGHVSAYESAGRMNEKKYMIVSSEEGETRFDISGAYNLYLLRGKAVEARWIPRLRSTLGRPSIPLQIEVEGVVERSFSQGENIYRKLRRDAILSAIVFFISLAYFSLAPWFYS